MKNLIFRLTLLALATLTITLYSCQQEDIFEDATELVLQDADIDYRGPNIIATSVSRGSCCSYKNRKVNITLDQVTYDHYCDNGGSLMYRFSRPGASTITKTSSSATPSFCLSLRSYTLVITDGVSSSPTYSVNLSGICTGGGPIGPTPSIK